MLVDFTSKRGITTTGDRIGYRRSGYGRRGTVVGVRSSVLGTLGIPDTGAIFASASGGLPTMAYRCEVCGKEPWTGKQVSFSHKRSSKTWRPNIQKIRVKHGSNSRRARVCTSCIKAGKVEKV
jgi:large subunit ribosomal protein L28